MKAEQSTQKACLDYLVTVLPIEYDVTKIDNEGRQANQWGQKAQGLNKGASDLIIAFPTIYTPYVVWCEVKTRKLVAGKRLGYRFEETTQSNAQKDFQAKMIRLGQAYWLAPTTLDFALYVEFWCTHNGLQTRLTNHSRTELFTSAFNKYGPDYRKRFSVN